MTIGATTAEKLEGTSSGADADPLPFHPSSLPHLPLLLRLCFANSLPYSSFPLPLNTARRFFCGWDFLGCPCCPRNASQMQKLKATRYTWSPRSPKLEARTRPTGHIGPRWLRLCEGEGCMHVCVRDQPLLRRRMRTLTLKCKRSQ